MDGQVVGESEATESSSRVRDGSSPRLSAAILASSASVTSAVPSAVRSCMAGSRRWSVPSKVRKPYHPVKRLSPQSCGVVRSTIARRSPPGERAERAVVRRAEPGGAEHVGDLGRARSAPAASPGGRRPSGRPAGGRRPRAGRRISPSSARVSSTARSRRASAPRARPTSVIHASQRLGLAGQRAQHVEGVDVARALPDRVERRLAVEQRQPGLLDVAVAAEALQRLGDHGRACACRPRTSPAAARSGAAPPRAGRRGRSTAAASRIASAVAASDSTARSASTFCISGLSASSDAERRAVRDVPRRLGQRAPHQRRPSRARSRAGSRRPSR